MRPVVTDVAQSVCCCSVYPLVTSVSCAKMAELVVM